MPKYTFNKSLIYLYFNVYYKLKCALNLHFIWNKKVLIMYYIWCFFEALLLTSLTTFMQIPTLEGAVQAYIHTKFATNITQICIFDTTEENCLK